jgi:DUF305 family protein family protein
MLMVASQTGEVRIFERWWRSWFDASMPLCSASERAAMPGLLSDGQMQQIKSAAPDQFDTLFIHLMSIHHAGAVKMAIKPGVGRAILGSALWRTRSVTDSRARSTSCTVPPGLMRSTPHSGI